MKKYFIYNRKSTDEADKQELSLASQSRENHELAQRLNLIIGKEFFESKSARKKGRPVFNQMLEEIKQGKAHGIIAWKLDRITRNLFDTATVAELIDQDIDFKFCSGSFDKSPSGKANLAVQGAFAKLFVDQLSEDTKRGLREKFLRGEFPGWAPTGYKHVDGEILIDELKAPYIIRAFKLYAQDLDMSLSKLSEILTSEGLKSRSGKDINKGTMECILKNPFYYGAIKWGGEIGKGTHIPLISKELFDEVQTRLHQKNNPRPIKYFFVFRHLMVCGECGRKITAETHKGFTYYRCTKSGGQHSCSQPYAREEDLDKQIAEGVKMIAIDDEILEYIRDGLRASHSEEKEYRDNAFKELNRQYGQVQSKLDSLLEAMLDETISKEIYKEKANLLNIKKQEIDDQIIKYKNANESWFENAEKFLEFAHNSYKAYKIANSEQKYRLVSKISSNSPLNNKKVRFNLKEPFTVLAKGTSFVKNSDWLPKWDDFRRTNWAVKLKFPQLVLEQSRQLLSIVS